MTDTSRVLSQLTHLEIFNVLGNTQIDLKGWIANQHFLVDSVSSSGIFSLAVKDVDYLKIALANDCNRMAMAAVESIAGVQKDALLPQSSSWAVIRAYYATFFAIHSVLRIFGRSMSQLSDEHLSKITELATAQNILLPARGLDNGFYEIRISRDFSKVEFFQKKDSHKDTWGCFLDLIEWIEANLEHVTAISKHRLAVYDLLMEIKLGITKSNHKSHKDKGNWLSDIRNKVNYQHLFGAWYPYESKGIDPRFIESASINWRNDVTSFNINNRGKDLEIFFELTSILLAMFRELLLECAEKSGSTNKIFSNGVIRLLKQVTRP